MSSDKTRRVLILADWFPPATKAGGPSKALQGIVGFESVHGHDVVVVTRDRDLGDAHPYPCDLPAEVQGARVRRVRPEVKALLRACRDIREPDILYLNSIFSRWFTGLPLLLVAVRWLRPGALLIAPRGELGHGALSIRGLPKKVWLMVFHLVLRVPPRVVWHASSPREEADVRQFLASRPDKVVVQTDPPPTPVCVSPGSNATPQIAFCARMVPIKNFALVCAAVSLLRLPVVVKVAGSLEDPVYWQQCQGLMADAPANVQFEVLGHLESPAVTDLLCASDLMVLPTRGENFGYAIAESLSYGCPVAIPDTTPWTEVVRSGGGWIISPDSPAVLADLLAELFESGRTRAPETRALAFEAYARWWQMEEEGRTSLFSGVGEG